MNLIRAFIAIPLPSSLREKIDQNLAPLRQDAQNLVRWVPPQNIHLTLKFLGDIRPADVETLKQSLATALAHERAFEMSIKKLGAFPGISRPRVLWIGVEDKGRLSSLQQRLETAASQIGVEPDRNPFSPHLTIGRVKKYVRKKGSAQIQKTIRANQNVDFGAMRVESIHLVESKLKSTGAVYRSLYTANLIN